MNGRWDDKTESETIAVPVTWQSPTEIYDVVAISLSRQLSSKNEFPGLTRCGDAKIRSMFIDVGYDVCRCRLSVGIGWLETVCDQAEVWPRGEA